MAEPQVVLDNPTRWKAVSHPLRLSILRLLAGGEMTNEELATELGVASGKLYFHTKKLLDAGLIEAAPTRQKGPLTEKPYRVVSDGFHIPILSDGSAPPLLHFLINALRLYEATWREADGKDFTQIGYHVMYYQTAENEAKFLKQLDQLCNEFVAAACQPNDDTARMVSIGAIAHPTFAPKPS